MGTFAAARRSPEDQGGQPVVYDGLPDHSIESFALAEQLVEACGTHALSQRLG